MKNKIITFTFSIVIISVFILNILSPIKDISYSERRELQKFPKLTMDKIFSSDFIKKFDKYALDQFILRDKFRSIKALYEFNIFNKSDNNDIYVIDDSVFKMEYPLSLKNVRRMSDYLNKVYDMYLQDCNVFYSIIPDKNYFAADKNGYLSIDYEKLEKTMLDSIDNMTYIDIKDCLDIDDYYRTDTHWKQENLDDVVKRISDKMGFTSDVNNIDYTIKSYSPFYGVYYGQSALNIEPDTLKYKVSSTIENAIVSNYEYTDEENNPLKVYDEKKLGKMDSYDVFLSGSSPLITIENPDNKTGKELIIFRDSFASSLTPLLIEEYSKITLVDLRYVSHKIIGEFVDFYDQDVLFLYSTLVVNNSNILK